MTDVILTGFMGVGKTTVGSVLAGRLGVPFLDLDREIERRSGRSIASIFAEEGEEEFRRREGELLSELSAGNGRVIATGGGALISAANRARLTTGQRVICLTCDVSELKRRLDGDGTRPLLRGGDAIEDLLSRRNSIYRTFKCVDTTGRAPDDVAREIAAMASLERVGSIDFEPRMTSEVLFGRGLLDEVGARCGAGGRHAMIVADRTVQRLGLVDRVAASLQRAGADLGTAVIPTGERQKSLAGLGRLYRKAMEERLDRRSTVVAVGGGVILDLAGMLAATYLRGISLVNVPTTLLAQVDAAVGGKVAVDVAGAKNLAGAFYPAERVIIDPDVIGTLPLRRLADGLAEVVKTGAMLSEELLERVSGLSRPEQICDAPEIIRMTAAQKIDLVRRDPYERGNRALLNFGHTIGHALEAASGYRLSHGEAISAGMISEAWLAEERGWCEPGVARALRALLERFGLPASVSGLKPAEVLSFVQHDKKRAGSQIRVAVPDRPGHGVIVGVRGEDLRRAVERALGETE